MNSDDQADRSINKLLPKVHNQITSAPMSPPLMPKKRNTSLGAQDALLKLREEASAIVRAQQDDILNN